MQSLKNGCLWIGTAGWSVPAAQAGHFPQQGSHLARYGQVFPAVEINSSFYRPHRPATYARWADTVPPGFRFAVKLPKRITHEARLEGAEDILARFLEETARLDRKRGPLLVQLPPSLAFDATICGAFFEMLRGRCDGPVACEPRHPSWFRDDVDLLLGRFRVARVAADPAVVPRAAEPGGWTELRYYRLHGSPRIYYSAYAPEHLARLRHHLFGETGEVWCIFDNTAEGAAMHDALAVLRG
ncbi:MAG: DUF72 domain-containing protein [Acetobacteraceae bacterium]